MMQLLTNAFSNALSAVFTFIPHLVGALVILLIGWIVAWVVGKAVMLLLRKVGFDRLSNRIGLRRMEQRMGIRMDPAQLLGKIVFWFLFLIFLVPATDALELPTVSNILNTVVSYIPNVFVAIVVLVLGALIGVLVGDIVRGATSPSRVGNPDTFAAMARWAIIGFAVLIALQQLEIAPVLITVLLAAVLGALALAFGLSFGLGGRDAAQRLLSRSESNLMGGRSYDPSQMVQQAPADLEQTKQVDQQRIQPPAPGSPPPLTPGYNDPHPHRPTAPRS